MKILPSLIAATALLILSSSPAAIADQLLLGGAKTNVVAVSLAQSPFTYTPSAGTVAVDVYLYAGGGGGGGGALENSSIACSAAAAAAAAAAFTGHVVYGGRARASQSVTVGAGGAAGAASTTAGAAGGVGGAGGYTSFGSLLKVYGGGGGAAGNLMASHPAGAAAADWDTQRQTVPARPAALEIITVSMAGRVARRL